MFYFIVEKYIKVELIFEILVRDIFYIFKICYILVEIMK